MRNAITATIAVAAGLAVASMLGVAAAEAPTTTTPTRTVSVDGVAGVPIEQSANLAAATAAYRAGMAAAVTDGKGKAESLASDAGATLGLVQSIVEGGGWIECRGGEGEEYAEYQGERPDFGSRVVTAVAPQAALARPTLSPSIRKPAAKHKKKATAKKASAVTCTLKAEVSLAYAIS
jgi:hypothetical protein